MEESGYNFAKLRTASTKYQSIGHQTSFLNAIYLAKELAANPIFRLQYLAKTMDSYRIHRLYNDMT